MKNNKHDIVNALSAIFLVDEVSPANRCILSVSRLIMDKIEEGDYDIEDQIRGLLKISELMSPDEEMKIYLSNAVKNIVDILDQRDECAFCLTELVKQKAGLLGLKIKFVGPDVVFSACCQIGGSTVTRNLMQNAVLHGGATEISITVRNDVIVVEDNGTGVSESVKGRIFDKGVTTKVGEPGGDGLCLCQELLALVGSSIEETSEEGKGARFEISIPKKNIVSII